MKQPDQPVALIMERVGAGLRDPQSLCPNPNPNPNSSGARDLQRHSLRSAGGVLVGNHVCLGPLCGVIHRSRPLRRYRGPGCPPVPREPVTAEPWIRHSSAQTAQNPCSFRDTFSSPKALCSALSKNTAQSLGHQQLQ